MQKKDIDDFNRIDEITKSIKKLYTKLFELEYNKEKDTKEYTEYLSYLKIALATEEKIYKSISLNVAERLYKDYSTPYYTNYYYNEYICPNLFFDEKRRKANNAAIIYDSYSKDDDNNNNIKVISNDNSASGQVLVQEIMSALNESDLFKEMNGNQLKLVNNYVSSNILYEFLFRNSTDIYLKYNMAFKESDVIEHILISNNMNVEAELSTAQAKINYLTSNPPLNEMQQLTYDDYYNTKTSLIIKGLIDSVNKGDNEAFNKCVTLFDITLPYLSQESLDTIKERYTNIRPKLNPLIISILDNYLRSSRSKN